VTEHFIRTDRLILRKWKDSDLEPFVRMNQDPIVMEYFPSCFSYEQSLQLMQKIRFKMERDGYGFFAVSLIGGADFIGMIGLNKIDPSEMAVPFVPAVEIGWRLLPEFWGKGLAQEGAKACIKYGFEKLHLKEIIAFTTVANYRSRNVMEKIHMKQDLDGDFDHPNVPVGNPLRKHVLYRISQK
jgi:3-dehydroquinate dehydratase/shikimate dehydrogenase